MTATTGQTKPEGPMSEDELATALGADLEDAATYADTELGPLRAAAIHYYHARRFGDEEDGRSQVVMPVVRDTIRATLPSLMRKFFGTKEVVTFSGASSVGGDFADDATSTVNYVVTVQNDGYSVLWDAFKDALRCKTGWIKWWWDESVIVSAEKFSGLSEQEMLVAQHELTKGQKLEIVSKEVIGQRQVTSMVPAAQHPAMQQAIAQHVANGGSRSPVAETGEGLQIPGPPTDGAGDDGGESDQNPDTDDQLNGSDFEGNEGNDQEEGGENPGESDQAQQAPPHPLQGAPSHLPMQHSVPVYSYTIRIITKKPKKQIVIESVPPDEIIFPHDAWKLGKARLIAHRTRKTRGELVAMGVNPDDLESIPSDDVDQLTNLEFLARQTIPDSVMTQAQSATWDQTRVPYYECYYRIDADGDGISELRKICRIGKTGKIVSNEIWDEVPLALLCPDPEPHVIVGLSQADYIMDVQNIQSHVWRDLLDSLKQSIFPRMAYVEGQANLDDVLNSEIGAAIRMRAPGMVTPLTVPFTGQNAFPLLEQLDQVREQRTGVGNSALALDGSALQSTTPAAAEATVAASQAQVELTARMFANGVAAMMRGVLKLLVRHQDQEMQFELNGRTFNVDPTKWNPDLNTIIDTGLGSGANTAKQLEVYDGVAQAQMALLQRYGPNNPLCGFQEYFNTVTTMMKLGGVKDTHRYWLDPTQSQKQGKSLPPPQPTQPQIESETQLSIEKQRSDLERLKLILADFREGDKLSIDGQLRLIEINAKYGTHFDAKLIDAKIAADRHATMLAVAQTNAEAAPAAPAQQ